MKFGVCLPNYGNYLSKQALTQSSRLAEELGYDSVWTTDHVLVPKKHADPYGNILDSMTTLAYIGAITQKVHLGTSILVLPMRNPILVAKQAATIDYLTDGRLILGAGVGWMEEEFQNLGSSFRDRGRRFEESIELIRAVYQNEEPKFQGRYYRFTDAVFKPKPRRAGGPMIWFGGDSEPVLRRAARLADGWHPVGPTLESFRMSVETIRSLLPKGKQFTFSARMLVDLDGKAKPYLGSGGQSRDVISGTRDQVAQIIEKYQEAGLGHLVCYFNDIELKLLTEKMTRVAKEIMPSFR